MNKNKSAKDLAFEKERAKYRKQIKELESQLKEEKQKSLKLANDSLKICDQYRTLQDWVRRLLEYTELSEEDMKKIIQKDLDQAEAVNKFKHIMKFLEFGSLL